VVVARADRARWRRTQRFSHGASIGYAASSDISDEDPGAVQTLCLWAYMHLVQLRCAMRKIQSIFAAMLM
jgi:hypothetical protein